MGVSDLKSIELALFHRESRVRPSVIGLVAEQDFARAQAAIPDLAEYVDYEDWLDYRQGLQIGLAMAGVDATVVQVSLQSFLEWRSLTGARLGERALDAFAAWTLAARNASQSEALAVGGERDYATRSPLVEALVGLDD